MFHSVGVKGADSRQEDSRQETDQAINRIADWAGNYANSISFAVYGLDGLRG